MLFFYKRKNNIEYKSSTRYPATNLKTRSFVIVR